MPKLRPPRLPPEFRAIRDNPDLTEDEKIDAVWDLLARRGMPIIRPPDIPEDEFDLRDHRERTFYQALRGKDGKLRMVSPKFVGQSSGMSFSTQMRTDGGGL